MHRRSSSAQPLTFSVSLDRSLTKILLATSNAEPTTPENGDGLCGWATPEACGSRAATTDCDNLTTREDVEPTRFTVGRYNIHAPGTTLLSYGDLKEAGCVDRRTFSYVPDNGAYLSCKEAVRLSRTSRRRCYGFGRAAGRTRSTRGGEAGGGATSRRADTSASRRDVAAVRPQRANNCAATSQTWRNDDDPVEQADVGDLPSSQHQSRSGSVDVVKEKEDARPSRGRNGGEAAAAAAAAGKCSGDVGSAESINTEQCSNGGVMKTWLYNFLPPIATTHPDMHGDADPLRGNLADGRDYAMSTSRTASSRSYGRRLGDERHPPIIVGHKLAARSDDRDREKGSARQQQQPPPSADTDAAVERGRRRGHAERWRRRRLSGGTPTDAYQVFLTEVCQPSHCDSRDLYSDDEDTATTSTTSRMADDDDDDDDDESDDNSTDDDDDNDDAEEEEDKKEKDALTSFNSKKLDKIERGEARQCLQLSLTGHVVDMHRRHEKIVTLT